MRFVNYLLASSCLLSYAIADIPDCPFSDTVRLDNSTKQPDGSYIYQGEMIPPHLVGDYDYYYNAENKTSVHWHQRGCACKLKPCIRMCCKGIMTDKGQETCSTRLRLNGQKPSVPIKWANGSMGQIDIMVDKQRFFRRVLPMTRRVAVDSDWHLLENGLVQYRLEGAESPPESYHDTCILLARSDVNDSVLVYKVFRESKVNEYAIIHSVTGYIMIASVVLMVLVTVNLVRDHKTWKWLHELQLSYVLSLTLTFSIMSSIILSAEPPKWCGFVMYYCALGAFVILTIISYILMVNAWQTSHAKTVTQVHIGWLLLLGYGVPMGPTVYLVYLQYFMGDGHKPFPTRSWFEELDWPICRYFYVPIGILLTFNALCFLATTYTVYRSRSGIKAASNHQKNNLVLYVRLFLTMGVTWSLDVIAYALSEVILLTHIASIVGASQGVLIFGIFLMEKYRNIKRNAATCNWLLVLRQPWAKGDLSRISMETRESNLRDSHPSHRSSSTATS